ncbi:hypothetical protein CLOM_g6401, partial [Closterium sp. NIES-68]
LSVYGRTSPVLLTGHSLGGGLAVLASAAFSSAPLPLSAAPSLSPRAVDDAAATSDDGYGSSALFSGSLVLPVLAFSPAGARSAALRRRLTFAAERSNLAYSIADVWDPLIQLAPYQQLGSLYLYRSSEPPPCQACYGNGSLPCGTPDDGADGKEHERPTLLQLLQSSSTAPNPMRPQNPPVHGQNLGTADEATSGNRSASNDPPPPPAACTSCFLSTHILRHVMALVYNSPRPSCAPVPMPPAHGSMPSHRWVSHGGNHLRAAA